MRYSFDANTRAWRQHSNRLHRIPVAYSPVGHWNLDASNVDSSGNGYDFAGSYVGRFAYAEPGFKVLLSDAAWLINDAAFRIASDVTITALICPTFTLLAGTSSQPIAGCVAAGTTSASNTQWRLWLNYQGYHFGREHGTKTLDELVYPGVEPQTWHVITARAASGTASIWIRGEKVAEGAVANADGGSSTQLNLGAIKGYIGGLAVHASALSDAQIKALADAVMEP